MQPLLGGPRAALSEAVVRDSLRPGGDVRWGVDVLDSDDAETGVRQPAEEGEVSWSLRLPDPTQPGGESREEAGVRRRFTLTVIGDLAFDVHSQRLRPWIEMRSVAYDVWVRWHQGVFVSALPPARFDGRMVRRTLQLADKTHRYSRRKLIEGVVVPAGTNTVDYVQTSLGTEFGETTFAFTATTDTLDEDLYVEADGQASWQTLYNRALGAIGYDALTCDEDGRPMSVPLDVIAGRGSEWHYGAGQEGGLFPEGDLEPLMPEIPNVLRVVARQGPTLPEIGNGIVELRNESTGPASIASRGGEEVPVTVDVDAEDQDALDRAAAAYAQRVFAGGGQRYTGDVALNPRHSDQDVVSVTKGALGLYGVVFQCASWRLPLRRYVDESAVRMPVSLERRVSL